MTTIYLLGRTGDFAENKDLAREIRIKEIIPNLNKGEEVILDFSGINSATQSFIHALISDIIRKKGVKVLDKILFKNCNKKVQTIISIVVDYVQDSLLETN
ncbi:MAG TPA: STAS-like domain-containing protein [Ignavibacteriaceae bacterium]|nr:STAS-like domain-containing protein [Ignavibacteriaceae bacterium]